MPKLTAMSESIRVAQALKALQLMQSGITQVEACRQAGISDDQFRYWISKGEESIEAFRQLINELERRQVVRIMSNQEGILDLLIQDALSESVRPADRLAIANYLDHRLEELAHAQNAAGVTEDEAATFLSGPKLEKAPSRLRGATVNIYARSDGSVDVTSYREEDVIDVPEEEQ